MPEDTSARELRESRAWPYDRRSMLGLYRSMKDIRREGSEALLRPQVEAALRALRSRGMKVQAIGSFAKPDAYFDPNSDIDLLVEDSGGRSDLEIWRIAREWIRDAEVDLVFANALDAEMLGFMRHGVRQ
ncbi:nucleotidyltransferase domain-containing protein [Variovorax sp. HW608]|uniref:nucleotidyltransferase domain-containing protein n=1 Tax=Variovorax sp. HW608 TaxID=1034889 RepID=UPI0012FD9AD1|nr:nucleotidyltransferase domain-containing protein [Variovorax sp. HW608]